MPRVTHIWYALNIGLPLVVRKFTVVQRSKSAIYRCGLLASWNSWLKLGMVKCSEFKKGCMYNSWKKVGILATGCRSWGTRNDAKRQNDVKLQQLAENKRNNSPKRVLFRCLRYFQLWYIYIYIRRWVVIPPNKWLILKYLFVYKLH